jgi:hypothetical protein
MKLKTAIKLALVGAVLAGGAANADVIANTGLSTSGSDLVLFVSDTTSHSYYTYDLGTQLGSLFNISRVVSDAAAGNDYNLATGNVGSFTTSASLGLTAPGLASFLGATAAGDNVKWSILATNTSGGSFAAGSRLFLASAPTDTLFQGEGNSSQASTMAGATTTFFGNVNAAGGASGPLTSTAIGWGVGAGASAPNSFVGPDFANGGDVGTAQNLYILATYGNGNDANVYASTNTITLSNAGVLTVSGTTPAVPLPAAVWLFGSGLLGLVGVGRRKAA